MADVARLRAGTTLTARLRADGQALTKEDGPGWPTCAPPAGPRSSSPATLWAAPCSGPRVSWAWPWPGGPRPPRPSPPLPREPVRSRAAEADTGYAARDLTGSL